MKLTGTVLRCSTRKVNSSGKETYVTNLLVLDPENSAAVARSQECSNMQGRIGMAERVGFEPTVRFPARSLSRRVLSTAQSPLRGRCRLNRIRALRFSVIGRGHYANALGSTEPSLCHATGREGQRENRECTGQSQRYSRRAAKK